MAVTAGPGGGKRPADGGVSAGPGGGKGYGDPGGGLAGAVGASEAPGGKGGGYISKFKRKIPSLTTDVTPEGETPTQTTGAPAKNAKAVATTPTAAPASTTPAAASAVTPTTAPVAMAPVTPGLLGAGVPEVTPLSAPVARIRSPVIAENPLLRRRRLAQVATGYGFE